MRLVAVVGYELVKIDGGLAMVVGIMGSGKSLFEVRGGVNHMLGGGWWVTNIPLYGHGELAHMPDALDRIAKHVAPVNRQKRLRVYNHLRSRYVLVDDLEHALTHSAHPSIRKPGHAPVRLGWDESLTDLNAREWNGGRGKSADDRANLFERIPMLRKNGIQCYLLVQHEELLDKNARRIANWYIRLQNQSETHRFMGRRIKGAPALFLAYWYQGNKADKSNRTITADITQRYFRGYYGNLYDTLGLYGISKRDAEDGRVTWLGAPSGHELTAARHERPELDQAELPELPSGPATTLEAL